MLISKKPIGTMSYLGGVYAVPELFCWFWGQTIDYTKEYLCKPDEYVHLLRSISSYHITARNNLSRNFFGDWLLMMDTDQIAEPDIVARMVTLMYEKDLDVLTALYRYKAYPFLPSVYHYNGCAFDVVSELNWNADLVPIDCCGAGTLLVRRRVFDRIRGELHEEPFESLGVTGGSERLSEDFSFCERLRRLGIQLWLAPKIYSRHLMVKPIENEDYDPSMVQTVPIPTGGQKVIRA